VVAEKGRATEAVWQGPSSVPLSYPQYRTPALAWLRVFMADYPIVRRLNMRKYVSSTHITIYSDGSSNSAGRSCTGGTGASGSIEWLETSSGACRRGGRPLLG
jgi:hypothetical protein